MSVTIDPTNLCDLNCIWCKTRDFRKQFPTSIPDTTFVSLPEGLADWGVGNVVLSGGEPFLHPKIVDFLVNSEKHGVSVGIKTNGVSLTRDRKREAALTAKWIGFSVDAAHPDTYYRVKRAMESTFATVLQNIQALVRARQGKSPRLTMKFLFHHLNYIDVANFIRMAKDLGVDEVHLRPISDVNYVYTRGVRKTAELGLIDARNEFETADFKIYAIVRKYSRDWTPNTPSPRCLAPMLSGIFAADTNFYLCGDHRGDPENSLGSFLSFKDFRQRWGSPDHRRKMQAVNPRLCRHCGMILYNEAIEKGLAQDGMFLDFL